MRTKVVKILAPLDAFAVENPCNPGTPDINYIGGWIECKRTKAWPKRAATAVRLDHKLLPSQKIWLRRRCTNGGIALVLVQIAQEFLLFWGSSAARDLGRVNRETLVARALLHCHGWRDLENKLVEFLWNFGSIES